MLDECPTWSVQDVALELRIVALVVNGEMLTFEHGIVDQMVVQFFVLDVPHFVGDLSVRPMDVGQRAPRLRSEVVDVVVPQLCDLLNVVHNNL